MHEALYTPEMTRLGCLQGHPERETLKASSQYVLSSLNIGELSQGAQ